MKISAIAIYEIDNPSHTKTLKRIKSAQKTQLGLFSANPLSNFEAMVYPRIETDLAATYSLEYRAEGDFIYIQKFPHESSLLMAVIISERPILPMEWRFLFHNIRQVFLYENKINVTLEEIRMNPINYIGRDLFCTTSRQQVEKLKEEVVVVIDKVLERGDALDRLNSDTIKLTDATRAFVEETEKLNKCCRYF